MSIFPFSRSQAPSFAPNAYLEEFVSGDEAAAVLKVTGGRWRQITGTREDPHPLLTPHVTPGVRGARWHLRDVLAYALAEDRETAVPMPPLLPLPSDPGTGPRYVQPTDVPARVRLGRELTATGPFGSATVWAQWFEPTSAVRCGVRESSVLMVTPLWPSTQFDVQQVVESVVREAVATAGWSEHFRPGRDWLTVVVLPVGNDPLLRSVRQLVFTAAEVADLVMRRPLAARSVVAQMPAADVAACVGWPALPWWPEGTATRSLCALWEPGKPATTPVPASLADRARLAQWITRQEPWGRVTQADYAQLARMCDPARTDRRGFHAQVEPAEGFELAVDIRWDLSSPDQQPGQPDAFAALDQIMASQDVPADIEATLRPWLGDPTYAAPAHYDFDDLPDEWVGLIREGLPYLDDKGDLDTPRWRHLRQVHEQQTLELHPDTPMDADEWDFAVIGPLHAPVIVDEHGITFAAPTGHAPFYGIFPEVPARAIDGQVESVLLLASSEGHYRGLYRTTHGVLGVLPAKAQFLVGLEGQMAVLAAAFTGHDVRDLITPITTAHDDSTCTAELRGLLAKSTTALTIDPSTITHAAESACQLWHQGHRHTPGAAGDAGVWGR